MHQALVPNGMLVRVGDDTTKRMRRREVMLVRINTTTTYGMLSRVGEFATMRILLTK